MEKNSESRSSLKKRGSRVLLTLTTVYGILYLPLVILPSGIYFYRL